MFRFELGEPATPFEQLMGVMPKQSAHCLPKCYRHLLSDPRSEIIDFYPTDFKLDINGARFAWMGVNLLPFIDRERLVRAMRKAEKDLDAHQVERNALGHNYVFVAKEENSKSALQ
jgi:5'-3' exoribonuclease 2